MGRRRSGSSESSAVGCVSDSVRVYACWRPVPPLDRPRVAGWWLRTNRRLLLRLAQRRSSIVRCPPGRRVAPGISCCVYEAMLRLMRNVGRKRRENACSIWTARPRAALSQKRIRLRRYKVPAREQIQARRAPAHVFARVTTRGFSGISFLRQTSLGVANTEGAAAAAVFLSMMPAPLLAPRGSTGPCPQVPSCSRNSSPPDRCGLA